MYRVPDRSDGNETDLSVLTFGARVSVEHRVRAAGAFAAKQGQLAGRSAGKIVGDRSRRHHQNHVYETGFRDSAVFPG